MKHHYGWIIILLGAVVVACSSPTPEPKYKPAQSYYSNPYYDSSIAISKQINIAHQKAEALLDARIELQTYALDGIIKRYLNQSDSLIKINKMYVTQLNNAVTNY